MNKIAEITILRAVESLRFWRAVLENERVESSRLLLASTARPYIWPPFEEIEAICKCQECGHVRKHKGGAPAVRCDCGIYGYKNSQVIASKYQKFPSTVFGKVTLWEDVIEAPLGYRGKFGYPQSLMGAVCLLCKRLVPLEQTTLFILPGEMRKVGKKFGIPPDSILIICSTCRENTRLHVGYRLGWYLGLASTYGIPIDELPDFNEKD
jgi:hypothetical protein